MHPRALIINQQGFSLAEVAIAIAVIAIVIGSLVPALLSVRVAEQARTTAQNLQTVMHSIAGFVQSSGYVPCPIHPDNLLSTSASRGNCDIAVGVLPYQSLGLPQSFAKDAYGHWLTYAIDLRLANYVPTPPDTALPVSGVHGLCSMTYSASSALSVRIENSTTFQNNIAVMVLSHGANGRGAYKNLSEFDTDRMNLPTPACSASAGGERCNADDDTGFVAGLPVQGNDPFDDIFLYLDRNSLVTYLGNQGCSTPW